MGIGLRYQDERHVFAECFEKNVHFLRYPLLERTGVVRHGISTRLDGVSKGDLGTMNLSFTRGDDPKNVKENYQRMGDALGIPPESMVCSRQTHTTNIRVVTQKDAGKGVVQDCDYTDVDGLLTCVPGICLVTFYADCVPLLFVDPVRKAIASSHSGWRGTAARMGQVTVEAMRREFGSRPEDIVAAVGPSICGDCYEVSEDVIQCFRDAFSKTVWNRLFYKKENGKYQLDLWKANEQVLLDAGIQKEHLAVTNLCTCCNPGLLFSHRASGGKRGNLAAFLALKEDGR